jgi:hypothetical protein
VIRGDIDSAGLWGEVAMEIRKDAYLADVSIERAGEATAIVGKVVGVAPQALELYTLIDSRHFDYRTIEPTPAGQAFRIELGDQPSAANARLELIHISSIWYVVELPIPHRPAF